MDNHIAVKVNNLRKTFVLPQHKNTSLKQTVVNIARRNQAITQTVLNEVSFEVAKGDFFGIVGRNGSGKSTLLKILAGVYTPTSGGVWMDGKLTPFIELGVGFNPELSGRDNVYLNGALLGFTHKQMEAMYDEIVEFAELEPFMDQKLKNYSSGMQVRLAFSIAIKAKNDILIFDEVLAVGDEAFQRKCLDVFEKYKAEKQTLILVTHDMETVKKYCNKAILLNEGKIIESGDPRSVAKRYSELNQHSIDTDMSQNDAAHLQTKHLKLAVMDGAGKQNNSFDVDSLMRVQAAWGDVSDFESIGISIFKQSGEYITGINSRTADLPADWKESGEVELEFKLGIAPGVYRVIVEMFSSPGVIKDAILQGPRFTVKQKNMTWSGLVELEHKWRVVKDID